jgi:putative membrane protein
MFGNGYYFGGMHYIWWFVWFIFLVWIFLTPWTFPGYRRWKQTPLGILQQRFAAGEITKEEYEERKQILLKDGAK